MVTSHRSVTPLASRLALFWFGLPIPLVGCGIASHAYIPPLLCPVGSKPSADAPSPLPVRGANLVGFNTTRYVAPDAPLIPSVESFASVGGNWLAITFWWFQDHPECPQIRPDPDLYTISDEAVEAAVRAAQRLGLRVMLRPMIDLRDGTWRGHIQPSEAWFAEYEKFIIRYANLAQRLNTEALSVGTEFSKTEAYEAQWRQIIAAVREVYDGTVVYCANYDSAEALSWWDAVDVIGIDAYYPVAWFPGTGLEYMTCAWSHWLNVIERNVVSAFPDRPIWLTEIGVRSVLGAPRLPWCAADFCFWLVDTSIVDFDEQANYYHAALLATHQKPWLEGIFWWNWTLDLAADDLAADYSPQGKPAEQVLRKFWEEEFSR